VLALRQDGILGWAKIAFRGYRRAEPFLLYIAQWANLREKRRVAIRVITQVYTYNYALVIFV
jgi:hypothetical protein